MICRVRRVGRAASGCALDELGADPQKAGWLYGLYRTDTGATHPAGEWNTLRLSISTARCEHVINGVEYFDYVLHSDDFERRLANSKFAGGPEFAKADAGYMTRVDATRPACSRTGPPSPGWRVPWWPWAPMARAGAPIRHGCGAAAAVRRRSRPHLPPRKNMKRILTSFAISAMLLLGACASPHAKAPAAGMNAKCPMTGEAIEADSPTVDFQGHKVAFCCDKCIKKWDAMSDSEKQAKLAAMK